VEPQSEPQSELRIEPSAYRLPSTVSVSTTVDPCPNGTTTATKTQPDDDDRIRAAILAITDQRIARLATPPTNPTGYRDTVAGDVRRTHHHALTTAATDHPDWSAQQLARHVEPPTPPAAPRPPDPLEQAAIAQRKRDERLAAAARGEACPTCNGIGVVDNGDGTFIHCPACRT
jgi:hypothetical protein